MEAKLQSCNKYRLLHGIVHIIICSFVVQYSMRSRLTFVFRLNHKQTLKMTMKLLLDNNKTLGI
jgi:hypothetical protein